LTGHDGFHALLLDARDEHLDQFDEASLGASPIHAAAPQTKAPAGWGMPGQVNAHY